MGRASSHGRMAALMKGNSKMTKCMVEGCISRRMAPSLEGYGSMGGGKEGDNRLMHRGTSDGVNGILEKGLSTFNQER